MSATTGTRTWSGVFRSTSLGVGARAAPRPSLASIGLVAVLLAAIAAAVFGSHVANGGYYYDDWSNAARTFYPGLDNSFGTALHAFWGFTGYRPLLALYVPVLHLILGDSQGVHLTWALVLAVAMSTATFLVLATLGVERLHAAVIAVLVLVFPFSDATRLWATSATAHLTVTLFLCGLFLALRGLDQDSRGRAVACHAGAVALYVASLMIYELAAGAMLLAGVLYWLRSGSPRRAAVRAAVDVPIVIGALAITATSTTIAAGRTVADWLDHAAVIAREGVIVLGWTAFPFGQLSRAAVGLVALAALAVLVWRLLPASDPARDDLRRWLALMAAGAVAAAAAYAPFIPADPGYSPAGPGVVNRVNAFAAVGLVTCVYAAALVAGTLAFRGIRSWRGLASAFAVGCALVLAFGYIRIVERDEASWNAAFATEERILAGIERAVPDPVPDATIYSFGQPGFQTPNVPVFAANWDLNGALKLMYETDRVRGYPVFGDARIHCLGDGVRNEATTYVDRRMTPYGRVYFVDAAASEARLIEDREGCRRAAREFRPGALLAEAG